MVESNDNQAKDEAFEAAKTDLYKRWDLNKWEMVRGEDRAITPEHFGNPPADERWGGSVRTDGKTRIIFCMCDRKYKFAIFDRDDFTTLEHFNMTFDEIWPILKGMRAHYA